MAGTHGSKKESPYPAHTSSLGAVRLVPYTLRRLVSMFPTVLGAITVVFILIRLAPGDPLAFVLGSMDESITADDLAAMREQYGLNAPLWTQYLTYVVRTLSGDLGTSIHKGAPVLGLIWSQFHHTVALAFAGLLLAAAFGIPLGVIAALRRETRVDYFLMGWAVVGVSAPSFWIGLLLIYFLGFRLELFPMFGGGRGTTLSMVHALVLPALAVGIRSMALLARITRSSVIEILQQDYIRTATAKGVPPSRVTIFHALKNAAIPIITVLGLDLAALLGGTVTIEVVFSRPGLGRLLIESIFSRDYPLVQGCILFFSLTVIAINAIVDVLYTVVDPRVSYG